MHPDGPSRTAYRVALRRAAHQVFDTPVVFHDRFALPILGLQPHKLAGSDLRAPKRASSASLRAFLVARSLFAEESLASMVHSHGVTQYVLLGAGLDTFALRNPFSGLRVFEADHPATQRWKRQLLHSNGLHLPSTATLLETDFEVGGLARSLADAGCDPHQPTVFAMLGVVPYLTEAAFDHTLAMVGSLPGFHALLLDYGLPRHALPAPEQLAFDSLARRVAQAAEPFQLFLTEDQMAAKLCAHHLHPLQTLSASQINDRFFQARRSALRVLASGARLMLATGKGS